MSFFVSKYPQGTFSWADFFSKDIEAAKNFYTGLFGWTYEDMPTGHGRPDYTMFSLDGKYVAGGSPTFEPNMPSFWSSYISVNDAEAMAQKAESLGGKITMPAMDVLDSGRMATITDPTGASVSLWQPKNHIGAGVVNTVGAMCWNELYTPDLKKAKEFYSKLLGWTFQTDPKDNYTTIQNNGRPNGGMVQITPEMAGMPPRWMVYFTVKSRDESVAAVKVLGGIVWDAKDLPVGKLAFIGDPSQAAIVILEMATDPTPWEE